jgi:hypothetical protein
MLGEIFKGVFGKEVGEIFGKVFNVASLFVPQLAMIRTLDMIADAIKEGPEGLRKLPRLLSELELPNGIAIELPSIVSELVKGDEASVLALPGLLRGFGMENREVLGEVTNAVDSNDKIRSLLPSALKELGVPPELSRSITGLVDVITENNERIRAAREAQKNTGGDTPAADGQMPAADNAPANDPPEGGGEIITDIIGKDEDIRTRYGIPA